MNAQEARNRLALERLKRALRDGSITPDELKARLLRALKEEESKGPARMDTAFMAECEELLWRLHAPLTEGLRSGRREGWLRLREGMGRRSAAPRLAPLRGAGFALAGAALAAGLFFLGFQRLQPENLAAAPQRAASVTMPISESLTPDDGRSGLTTPFAAITPAPTPAPSPTPEPTPLPTGQPAAEEQPTARPQPAQEPSGPKYLTLGQLRAQAPARFTYNAASRSGADPVDAPVILPDGEALAVPRLGWILPEDAALLEFARKTADVESTRIFTAAQKQYFAITVSPGGQADGGRPMSERQAADLLEGAARAAGLSEDGLLLLRQDPETGLSRPLNGDQPDEAVSEAGNRYYLLTGAQTFGGAQLFPDDYHFAGPHFGLQASISASISGSGQFGIDGTLLRQSSLKAEDIPLADVERVLAQLRAMLDDGRLSGVDSIELGYELYYENYVSPKDSEAAARASLLALPVWRVMGRCEGEASGDVQPLTRGYDKELGIRYCELRFSAQTGEYQSPNDPAVKTYSPVLLTWQQLEGEEDVELYGR